ncbi:MAG: hypoxanthine phosphoribosyltransferase, partial [Clostridiales bacterium]|nr:hypoxanthine phosphoribosyltransferase [Clostridiales bacterium]
MELREHEITVYLTEDEVAGRIAQLGEEITQRFSGESVYLVCILKGAVFFATELAKRIRLPMTMDFMSVSSYGEATK